jgi:hypothetical protein
MKAMSVGIVVAVALGATILWRLGQIEPSKHPKTRPVNTQPSRVAPIDLPKADRGTHIALGPAEQASTEPVKAAESIAEQPKPSANLSGLSRIAIKNAPAVANPGGLSGKPDLADPLARVALAFVGMDSEAEAYWFEAINNPALSAHERQDLIEDLNEDGLSDPKRPTMDDLPVILNRLLIIEEVGIEPMDEVNAAAFQEAYKDLVNLANVAMGGGEPVR